MKLKVRTSPPPIAWTEVPGWDETTREYVDLDCERWLQENRIREQGRQNGEENFPAPDATQPDEMHQKIRAWVNRRGRACKDAVSKFLDLQRHSLELEGKEGMAPIRHAVEKLRDDAIVQLHDQGKTARARLQHAAREAEEAWNALSDFKETARLNRTAEEPNPRIGRIVGAVVGVEALINAFMLAEVQQHGLVGAFGTMLIIGVINAVALGWVLGEGWRLKNSVAPVRRSCGWLMVGLAMSALVTFNLIIGHFRDSILARVGQTDASIEELLADDSIARFTSDPFALDGLLSYVLAILGAGACLFAATKWFGRDDPYPGYGRVYRRANEKAQHYLDVSGESRAHLERIYTENTERINDARQQLQNKRGNYRLLTDTARRIIRNFPMHLRQYQDDLDFLIAAYRTENQRARSTPAPRFLKNGRQLTARCSRLRNGATYPPQTTMRTGTVSTKGLRRSARRT